MKNALPVVVGVLVGIVAFGGGYIVGAGREEAAKDSTSMHTDDGHSHDDKSSMHDHGMFEVDANNAPQVSVSVEEDAKSGFNVSISTMNFRFAPEKVNQENVAGEGHAHLYVGGEKVARIYGNYFHYPNSFDGTKSFKVTLNANDHSEYAVDGEVIADTVSVTHKAHD